MAGRSKKITLMIFLFSLLIFLSFYIGTNIYTIYKSETNSSKEITRSLLECSFSFSVSNLILDQDELNFKIETSDEDSFKRVILNTSTEIRIIELAPFIGYEQIIKVEDIKLDDTFLIYPEGCRDYNIKLCSLSSSKCENIK